MHIETPRSEKCNWKRCSNWSFRKSNFGRPLEQHGSKSDSYAVQLGSSLPLSISPSNVSLNNCDVGTEVYQQASIKLNGKRSNDEVDLSSSNLSIALKTEVLAPLPPFSNDHAYKTRPKIHVPVYLRMIIVLS